MLKFKRPPPDNVEKKRRISARRSVELKVSRRLRAKTNISTTPISTRRPTARRENRTRTSPTAIAVTIPPASNNERAAWPGYDYLMQAESGLMHLTGDPDGPPSRIGAPAMVDQATGLTAAVALLSGIIQARTSGKGCDMDISLLISVA